MLLAFEILTTLLVAVAMAASLAHVLELPGKLRLPKETYLAVQPIYYPGFTIAGVIGELGGMIATLLLVIFLSHAGAAFWLALGAFAAMLTVHGLYWILVHPVNNFWLKDVQLGLAGKGFFAIGSSNRDSPQKPPDWTELRNRWEYGHVARAVFAVLGLALVVAAVSSRI